MVLIVQVVVLGDLTLDGGTLNEGEGALLVTGWASGGYMAQCEVEGKTFAGGQQQWFARCSAYSSVYL